MTMQNISAAVTTATLIATIRPIITASDAPALGRVIKCVEEFVRLCCLHSYGNNLHTKTKHVWYIYYIIHVVCLSEGKTTN